MNVLAVGCHPDDLEIGCGGTLARYAREGHKVTMCHVANGNMGHVVIMPSELCLIRHSEAEHSATIIGAEIVDLDVPDLEVSAANKELVKEMIRLVRKVKPDIIITHSPDDYMNDHIQVQKLIEDASFSCSIPHYCEDVPVCGIVPVYYMDTLAGVNFLPEEYVDVSDEIEIKLNALAAHESQIKWMLEHDKIDFIDFVRTCSKFRGLQCGTAYAEGFRRCVTWPRLSTCRLLP